MLIKSPYAITYLIAIVMFALSVTISKILIVKCAWSWTLELVKVKCIYATQKPICTTSYLMAIVIFVLYLTLIGRRSYTNIPIERPDATSYVLAIAIFIMWCQRLRDNHIWTFKCTRYKSLTLKMEVQDNEDFDKNWRTNSNMSTSIWCAKIGASSFNRCFWCASSWYTYVHTYVHDLR